MFLLPQSAYGNVRLINLIRYGDKRRVERGGAPRRSWRRDHKNLKGDLDDEIPEWQFEEAVSGYNTFTIPYGKA